MNSSSTSVKKRKSCDIDTNQIHDEKWSNPKRPREESYQDLEEVPPLQNKSNTTPSMSSAYTELTNSYFTTINMFATFLDDPSSQKSKGNKLALIDAKKKEELQNELDKAMLSIRSYMDKEKMRNVIFQFFRSLLPTNFDQAEIKIKFKSKVIDKVREKKIGYTTIVLGVGPFIYEFDFEVEVPKIFKVIGNGGIRVERHLDTTKSKSDEESKFDYHVKLENYDHKVSVDYGIYNERHRNRIFRRLEFVMSNHFVKFIVDSLITKEEDADLHSTILETLESFVYFEPSITVETY